MAPPSRAVSTRAVGDIATWSRFVEALRTLEAGVQMIDAIAFIAKQYVNEVQQVLKNGGVQQRLDVCPIVVRGDEQRHVRM